ncbi:glycosyltransferase family 2 protein [Arcobacter sp. YIC-80]|uniref:glycosyltransferase family 2 protein n=1 Tax=Arcobacter sp. YIC-80 TaxID=3376683 RepID=UPI0038516691
MFLSFVVPTYNRACLIQETLDSILNTQFEVEYEVIIVDDCSSDNTQEMVKNKYKDEFTEGLFQYYYLDENIGVTGAKNYGAVIAKGKWVVFLDSDDLFIKESKDAFLTELKNNEKCGSVFFRCNTFDDKLLGKDFHKNEYYDLKKYLTVGFPGECLPVIKKDFAIKFPYEQKLRGFESVSYFRMLKSNVKICISPIIARKYRTENEDRLSNFKGRLKRSKQMFEGYNMYMKEYQTIDYSIPFCLKLRLVKYFLMKLISKIIR